MDEVIFGRIQRNRQFGMILDRKVAAKARQRWTSPAPATRKEIAHPARSAQRKCTLAGFSIDGHDGCHRILLDKCETTKNNAEFFESMNT